MNLTTLSDEIGRLLSDVTHDRWSQATLTTRINLAQTEIQGYTKALKYPNTITPTANAEKISIAANTMDVIRASKTLPGGEIKPFPGIDLEQLNYLYPDWKQWQPGEPLYWYYDAGDQTIHPVPRCDDNFVNGGGYFELTEIRTPTDLSAGTDIPFDSNNQMIPYHTAIVHYVVARCFMDDGTPEALGKSKFHKSGSMMNPGEYEKQLGRIMAEFDTATGVPAQILWKPQGGRIGGYGAPTKASPLAW